MKNKSQNEAMGANGAGQKEAWPCTQAMHDRAARLEKQQCGTGSPCHVARPCHISFCATKCSVAVTTREGEKIFFFFGALEKGRF